MRGVTTILAAALALTSGAGFAQQGVPSMPTPGRTQPLPGTENNVSERMTGAERNARTDSDHAIEETRRAPNRKRARAVAATSADLVVGAQVHDKQGALIGTIDAVDAGGATLKTAAGLARVGADGFGKNDAGLLLDISKADFEAQVAAQNP